MNEAPVGLPVLADMLLFAGLPPDILEDVSRHASRRRCGRGEILIRQDDPVSHLYAVLAGQLRVSQMTADGQQIIVRYVGRGDIAGYGALSGAQRYTGTVSAVEDTFLLGWPAAAMRSLMTRHAPIAVNALAIIGSRYRELQERLREHATESVDRRLAHTLLRLAEQAGRRTVQGIEIVIPLTRQDMAELSGTTLHTVSRTMSAWEDLGLVAGGRRRVVVRDAVALLRVAAGET